MTFATYQQPCETHEPLLLIVHVTIVISEWLWNKSTNQTMILLDTPCTIQEIFICSFY